MPGLGFLKILKTVKWKAVFGMSVYLPVTEWILYAFEGILKFKLVELYNKLLLILVWRQDLTL